MKKTLLCAVVSLSILAFSHCSFGAVNGGMTVSVRNAPLQDVIRMIADAMHMNAVIPNSVKGTVSLYVKGVSPQQTLDILKREYSLSIERNGNTLIVMPLSQVNSLITQENSFLVNQWNLMGTRMGVLVPKSIAVFHLKYMSADDAKSVIEKVIFNNSASLKYDPVVVYKKDNDLVVKAPQPTIDRIKSLIQKLDKPKKRIEIQAEIVEVNTNYEKSLGIEWGGVFGRNPETPYNGHYISVTGGSFMTDTDNSNLFNSSGADQSEEFLINLPASPTSAPIAADVGLLIGRAGYNALLRITAGEVEGYTKIISSPKIITDDGSEATISSGQEIPYQESAGASGATSVSFKSAALSLSVTPVVADNDSIILKINVSKDSPDYSHSINGEPPINTESVSTTVTVKSGQTIVIGGIVQKTREKEKAGVPGLKDIPLLGWLFSRTDVYTPSSKLYVFIKPTILKGD